MANHLFILETGFWHGEGKIQLNMIEEELLFQTTWNVLDISENGKIHCVQEIQIDGLSEKMKNELTFYDITSLGFSVEMSNHNVEKVQGKGIIDKGTLAWEFKDQEMNFEGFEIYHLEKDGGYKMHAEYVTSDQFRTKITGRIWQKKAQDQIEAKDHSDEQKGESD